MLSFQLHPVGDCALLAEFAQRIAPDIGAAVAALNSRVLAAKLPGVVETVPAFASLLITYDPLVTEYDTIADAVKSWLTPTVRTLRQGRGGSLQFLYAMAAISAPTCPLWRSTPG